MRHTCPVGHVDAAVPDHLEVVVLKNKGCVLVDADPELTRIVRHSPEQPPEAATLGKGFRCNFWHRSSEGQTKMQVTRLRQIRWQ